MSFVDARGLALFFFFCVAEFCLLLVVVYFQVWSLSVGVLVALILLYVSPCFGFEYVVV